MFNNNPSVIVLSASSIAGEEHLFEVLINHLIYFFADRLINEFKIVL